MQCELEFSQTVFMINLCLTSRTLNLYHLGFTILVYFIYMFLYIMSFVSFSVTGVTSEPDQILMFGFNVLFQVAFDF